VNKIKLDSLRNGLWGVVGSITALLGFLFLYAQWCGCTASSQTSGSLTVAKEALDSISGNAVSQKSLLVSGVGVKPPDSLPYLGNMQMKIFKTDTVFMYGGESGQLVVLIPKLVGDTVNWRCVGGSSKVTPSCSRFKYICKSQ
jgi:hypothetical protein